MALNWAMLQPDRSPIPLPHEQTIKTVDSGAEIIVNIPNAPPSSSANSGGSGGAKKLKEIGRLWLTDQRLIFATPNNVSSPSFESLSVPLLFILSTKFEQPMFGANYLALEIKPSAEGGLTDGTTAEIRLKDQGLFEFVATLEKTRERALFMKRNKAQEDEEGLPMYTSPADETTSGPGGSVPAENPPGYDA